MEILTTDQVLALAPDPASVKAGQGLANPGKWVSSGRAGRSVWGECQGSGKSPYRTQVDLTGPAFHCSCPSRKFPCKHGLGLLLMLAGNASRVAEGSAPAWVEEWIAKREASSEKKAAKAAEEAAPPDEETAARRAADREKRAAKREDRVRAGLAELQTWLGDFVRHGLAHAKQQPAQYFDGMAARMVDAQAPGIARRLREWPGIFASGDDWAGRALGEAGTLQWLLHGFARLETLPEGLQSSVRSAIGWTVAEQELTGIEPVRDRWQVTGQVVEEEDRLRVQRTWLFGEVTQRPALCLSFAAMNQALDVSLVAGTVIEADVVFYPSASPLRSLIRERHGAARALTVPAAMSGFGEALERTSELLAGDPWLERTPWFVRDCIPMRSGETWILRDASGTAVPLARSFAGAWQLFAVSGGEAVTVLGEWDGFSLLPLSVFAGGKIHFARRCKTMSAWKDCVTAALIGIEKAAPPTLPQSLAAAFDGNTAMDRECDFLTRAGALSLWRRAGWKPSPNAAEVRAAEAEITAAISSASAGHLRAMLGGHCAAVLPEWLSEIGRLQRHVPPEFLPALLDRARQDRSLRPLVIAAGGQRAVWLAGHNPDWGFAPTDSPDAWETGSRDQRVAMLRAQRLASPAEARAKIEAVWKTEPADVRSAFIAELATQLSDEDAPFLEAALDDRSKEVRRAAFDLLARLPASPFVARMTARATQLLGFKPGRLLGRGSIEVTLPADPDATATRDGLDPKAFGQQKALGEKATLLVLILSAVPLRHWTEAFQQQPAAIVKAAEKNEFARALATGWAWAALRQRDALWAETLLDGGIVPHGEFLPAAPLLDVLPESARAARFVTALKAGALRTRDSGDWHAFAAQLTSFSGQWPAPLAAEVLSALRHSASSGIEWHFRSAVESLVLRLPHEMLAGATHGWPAEQQGVAALVDLISFRHDALTALTQS